MIYSWEYFLFNFCDIWRNRVLSPPWVRHTSKSITSFRGPSIKYMTGHGPFIQRIPWGSNPKSPPCIDGRWRTLGCRWGSWGQFWYWAQWNCIEVGCEGGQNGWKHTKRRCRNWIASYFRETLQQTCDLMIAFLAPSSTWKPSLRLKIRTITRIGCSSKSLETIGTGLECDLMALYVEYSLLAQMGGF